MLKTVTNYIMTSCYGTKSNYTDKLKQPCRGLILNSGYINKNKQADLSFGNASFTLSLAKAYDRIFKKEAPNLLGKILEVDNCLFRGPNPGIKGLTKLKSAGFDVVINLRCEGKKHNGILKTEAEKLGMEYHNIPMNPFVTPGKEQIREFLGIVKNAEKNTGKVYFHCKDGWDRTGAMAARHRIKKQGWSSEDAFNEMLEAGHKHFWHRILFRKPGKWVRSLENNKPGPENLPGGTRTFDSAA